MSNKLAVSEQFYSIQGEGKTMGVRAVFLRLAGCNLMCGGMGTQFDGELHNGAKWRCDSIEVWMKGKQKEFADVLDKELLNEIRQGAHLVITGGEPLMQQAGIINYIYYLINEKKINPFVEIETNGTIIPNESLLKLVSQWNVSPKLLSSGNEKEIAIKDDVLNLLSTFNTQYKFVVDTEEDLVEILELKEIPRSKVWLMPAGENEELLKHKAENVAEICKLHKFNYSHRLHITLWNQKTGV